MTAVSLVEESRERAGAFYVPVVEVKVEGVGLPRDILRDITEVTYRDSIKEIDGFQLTVNNFDDVTRTLKYIEPDGESGGSDLGARYSTFEPCNKTVELRMGYVGQLELMLTGNFTTMEPSFPANGPPTLNVRGLNVLHQLRRKQYTHAWRDMKDSDIAENIATLNDGGKRRFPIPIRTDSEAKALEEAIPYAIEDNQYDIDFLLTRARRLGYVVYVDEADDESGREQSLYFGPSQSRTEPITYELKWGASLISFTPTFTTANQIRSVTVKGWDRGRQRKISETVTLDDPRVRRINGDLHEILNVCDPREEQVVHEPVFTAREARERATNLLLDRNRQIVKASGSTVGLPGLRAGRRVEIRNVGKLFSGTYFITSTTHTFSPQAGYTTRFEARREDQGEGGST